MPESLAPAPPAVADPTDGDRLDILLVDDLPNKLLALETVLAPLQQNLIKVASGREALQLILKRDFSLIILDINMPGIDGFETAALIRQRRSSAHTPIIFVTSFSTGDVEINRGYALGAVDYLFTPVMPEALRSKVSVFIDLNRKNREVLRQRETLRRVEEERLQRELQETHVRLEGETRRNQFFRLSIELLAIADYAGKFCHTNPTWQSTLGYSDAELSGRSFLDLVHPEDQPATRALLTEITRTKQPQYFENRFQHQNSTFRWLGWTIAPFAAEGLLYIFARDITERREQENEIRVLNQHLQTQALSLKSLNQELESLSYSISHDLRAPLRAISGYSEMILGGEAGGIPAEANKFLKAINTSSLQMLQLLDDFLNFFGVGRQEVKLSQVDMEATTRAAIAALPTSEGKRKITFKIAGLPQAYGDPAMVGQVLVNLLSNAVKFTARRRQTRIEIGCLPASRPVVYYVKDNGIGFNMEHYSKLFGVFQRLHSGADFAGTGIGLAIVQRIIQRHGGRIWAEAEVDAGATFYFTLAGA